jgi:hypothetical protein
MSISQSAIGVLGWLKKVAASGEAYPQADTREMFPIQRGVQLEFDALMADSTLLSHPTASRRQARRAASSHSVQRTLKS